MGSLRPTYVILLAQQAVQHAVHHGAQHQSGFMRWILHMGTVGLFLVSFLDGFVIPLPIPGSTDLLLLLLVVRHGNPWLLVPIALVATMLGGSLSWQLGKTGGEKALHRYTPKQILRPVEKWVKANGFLAVLVATVLPPPMPLTPIMLASGALGVPRNHFLLGFAIGRSIRYSVVAWLGVHYGRVILHAWRRYLADDAGAIGWGLAVFSVAGIGFGVYKFLKVRRELRGAPQEQMG
jgi:membrane protein YqaA with SNARE-associated domain